MKQGERIRRHRKVARLEASAWYRLAKRQVCLRLDADVLAWFKQRGRGYQTRINRALREVMQEEGGGGGRQAQASKGARPGAPSSL